MAKNSGRLKAAEMLDYVAVINRAVLRYGINHHYPRAMAPRPYSRSLYLYGSWALPADINGSACEIFVYGDPSLQEMPEDLPNKIVAVLMKQRDAAQATVPAPIEFIGTLSAAYASKQLDLFYASGSKPTRGHATLISVSFTDRKSFEDEWGAALP